MTPSRQQHARMLLFGKICPDIFLALENIFLLQFFFISSEFFLVEMQNKRKFDKLEVFDSDRKVETKLDLVDSDSKLEKPKPKQYLGRIYEVRSDRTPLFYVGSTIQSLQRRFQQHKDDSKHGISRWNKAFKEFKGSWKIKQVGKTILFVGISKQEIRKQLQDLEYSHMATCDPEMLWNDDLGDESIHSSVPKKDYSVDETQIIKQRRIERHEEKYHGSVWYAKERERWRFQWVDKNQHFSRSFPTQEAARVFQQTIFPKVVLPPNPSYVYMIFHPDQTKVYIGQTSLTLNARLSQHRSMAKGRGNEFYLLMKTTVPLTWQIKAIYTLYESSEKEIRAVELFCLRQYQPGELFNRNLNLGGMILQRYWSFSYRVCGKRGSKSFHETKTRSLQQAENEAKECQRKHIEARKGGNGTVSLRKRFNSYAHVSGTTMTKQFQINPSVSEEQAKAAAEVWIAEMRSKEDIRNEAIAKAAIEKSAKILREFQVKEVMNGMLDQLSNTIDV